MSAEPTTIINANDVLRENVNLIQRHSELNREIDDEKDGLNTEITLENNDSLVQIGTELSRKDNEEMTKENMFVLSESKNS